MSKKVEPSTKLTFAEGEAERIQDAWRKLVLEYLGANSNEWLFATVNISNRQLHFRDQIGSRTLLESKTPSTTNPLVWISGWDSTWKTFFKKLERFELGRSKPFKGSRPKPFAIRWCCVYENDGKRLDPKVCPTHSHLLIQVPTAESRDKFARRFCSAFNHHIYPLKISDKSLWRWDVERSNAGAQVLNVKPVTSTTVVNYLLKQGSKSQDRILLS